MSDTLISVVVALQTRLKHGQLKYQRTDLEILYMYYGNIMIPTLPYLLTPISYIAAILLCRYCIVYYLPTISLSLERLESQKGLSHAQCNHPLLIILSNHSWQHRLHHCQHTIIIAMLRASL